MIRWTEKQIGEHYINSPYVGVYEFTEVGDTLLMSLSVPFMGLTFIGSSPEFVTGLGDVVEAFPYGLFRVSVRVSSDEGLHWSGWSEDYQTLLSEASIKPEHCTLLEFSFVRIYEGPETPWVNSIRFDDVLEPLPVPDFYSQQETDLQVPYYNYTALSWALNVLQKVYKRGIVPSFIKRGDNHNWEDEDYIDLWWSLIYPIALRISFADEFSDLLWNPVLLRRFLEQRGLIVGNISGLDELYYLMSHFYDEMLRRGTLSVFDIDRTPGSEDTVRGELARLIDMKDNSDLFLGLINSWESGWWLNYSSPIGYENSDIYENYILGYENKITDAGKYPKNMVSGSLLRVLLGKYLQYIPLVPVGQEVQWGGIGSETLPEEKFRIPVSPHRSYLFKVRVKTYKANQAFHFGLRAFDAGGNRIEFLVGDSSQESSHFFEGTLKGGLSSWHTLVGVLKPYEETSMLPIDGVSRCLRFGENSSIVCVVPKLVSEAGFEVSEFRFCLLRPKFVYLESILDKVYGMLIKNRNLNYTNEQVEKIMKTKLLPLGLDVSINFE